MANKHSIVYWSSDLEKHRCGYCKQLNTNCSHGMWTEMLTVEDYQNLIDRGWRRSGKYCYKPAMNMTCCPLYTIRCEALNIKLSKSQKKIIKRVNKFLSEPEQDKSHDVHESNHDGISVEVFLREKPTTLIDISKIDTTAFDMSEENNSKVEITDEIHVPKCNVPSGGKPFVWNNERTNSVGTSSNSLNFKSGAGADPSKPPCKKAKLIRLERRQQKLTAKGMTDVQQNSTQNCGKTLEEFINDLNKNPIHRLRICLVETGSSKDWQKTRSQEYPIYKKYQMLIHNDPPEKCSEKQFTDFLFQSPFQTDVVRMSPEEPSFLLSAKLYEKYQIFVHNESAEECNVETYCEFLVDTPLEHTSPSNGPPCGYGSFHQQYWLDDKLIAVGVIDILPRCVSSVYFFYDPDYRHLTLGTYGSLREVEFTRELNKNVSDLKYYYMGFYIHSCPKMRYKANLAPSFLLCPETYEWFPMEKCISKLDAAPYSRLNEDMDALDENACTPTDLESAILIFKRHCIPYKHCKTKISYLAEEFTVFGNLVGNKCISKLFIISLKLESY